MAAITQTITTYTGTTPNKATQTPTVFSAAADEMVAFIEDLPPELNTFGTQANSLRTEVNTAKTDAETAKTAAQAAQAATETAANATKWLVGSTYAEGDVVWGSDHLGYRSVQGGNAGHDPVGDDGTWWAKMAAQPGVNADITSLTALDVGGIPLQAIANTYGVSWDEVADTYERTGSLAGQATSQTLSNALLPIQAAMRRCILNDAGELQYYLCATDSTKREDGVLVSDLTGGDGQVMVQIPKFYYRYDYTSTTHTWEISLFPSAGFSVHPAFIKNGEVVDYRYMSAYEGVGYDHSAASYIDSGCVAATNWSGGLIDLVNDKLGSVSGFCPMVDETRAEFRAISANRGTGWRQQDFDLASAIQLLYLIEYADWNSQLMIGEGRTALSGGTWTKDSYIGVTGKSNGDGNGTNSVGGNTNDAYMTYRGIENFFGNVWKWVDGININENVPYVCNIDTDFADDTASNYTDLGITLPAADGYQKYLEQQPRGFLPASVGSDSSTYITDYYYQSTGWRVVRLGGDASSGGGAGAAYFAAHGASSYDTPSLASRLCF